MTELLPEFTAMPEEGVFDGELVTFADDGLPSFDPALPQGPARRHHRAGERTWIKQKNSRWARYRAEREGAISRRARRS